MRTVDNRGDRVTVTVPSLAPEGVFETKNSQAAGRSAPGVFRSETFDFQLMRWLSQAPYSGSEIGECYATAHLIEDGNNESWLQEWQKTARRVEGAARECLARGHRVSAREAFLRATTYYEAAFFYSADSDPRKRELYDHHRECFPSAGALYGPPLETIAIPYEGRTLPGYFLRPDDSGTRRPTVLVMTGGDGTADAYTPMVRTMEMEELTAGAPVRADQLTQKQRYSVEEGMPRFGFRNDVGDIPAWGDMLKKMNLSGLEDKITCPLLNLSSTGEGKVMYDNARVFFDALPNPLNPFVLTTEDQGAEMHCQRGNSSLLHQIAFDWLDEILAT
jgi:hypothetical protein